MELAGKVVAITGAARGIGEAMARRFAAEKPQALVLSDIDSGRLEVVARETGGIALPADVSTEDGVAALASRTLLRFGRIDLFCSNAGVLTEGGPEVPDSEWNRLWTINVMAHVWAARALLPSMLERGSGYLLQTASAAGLLTSIGSAPYAATKHAALGFAEWLAVTYGDRGIRVSCLCPQFVRTDMVHGVKSPMRSWMLEGSIDAATVAETVVQGLRDERFLILPHPEVAEYFRRKAADYDRWLGGMRRLQSKLERLGAEPPAG